MDGGLHDGHKKRMRRRFSESIDFEEFSEHEILEALLNYVIIRKNANEISHRLLNRFGSIDDVLSASVEELMKVDDVGERTASFLKMQYSMLRYYNKSIVEKRGKISGMEELCLEIIEKVRGSILHCSEEYMFMATITKRGKLKRIIKMAVGAENFVAVTPRIIMEKCISDCANTIVMVHNHPSGLVKPSQDDLRFTINVHNALKVMDVTLHEHYVISEDEAYPIMKNTSVAFSGYLKSKL